MRDPPLPRSYLAGCAISNNGTDTAHDIDIAVGMCRDATNVVNILQNTAALTKQLDQPWAAGDGAGGLGTDELADTINMTFDKTASPDTITAASGTPFSVLSTGGDTIIIVNSDNNDGTYQSVSKTDTVITLGDGVLVQDDGPEDCEVYFINDELWYHVFLILDSSGTVDAGFDTSVTATNLLSNSGYEFYRRIGSVLTDTAANILQFTQTGDHFDWNAALTLNFDGSSGTGENSVTVDTPTGIVTRAWINVISITSTSIALVYPPSKDAVEPSKSAGPLASLSAAGSADHGNLLMSYTDASSAIILHTDSDETVRVATMGYDDTRGRDD